MAGTKNKNGDMTGRGIKVMLWLQGITLRQIATRAGVSPAAVSKALNDDAEYVGRRIRPVIAEALGMPVEKLWPPNSIPKKQAQ